MIRIFGIAGQFVCCWLLPRMIKKFFRQIKKRLKNVAASGFKDWRFVRAALSHYCAIWSDKWYAGLFSKERLSGDISPNYSTLSETTIQRIKQLNPQEKIIIGLRDPVDQRWSAIKMMLLKMKGKTDITEIDKVKLEKALCYDNPMSDYTTLLNKWRKYFNDEQILVYYFDELKEDPQKLFNKICRFLEITPVEIESINQKVNEGVIAKYPPEYEKIMVSVQYKYIEKFAENYPNKYSLAWLEKYRDYDGR